MTREDLNLFQAGGEASLLHGTNMNVGACMHSVYVSVNLWQKCYHTHIPSHFQQAFPAAQVERASHLHEICMH